MQYRRRTDGKGQFRFEWRESGGQLVSQPTCQGFGNAVLLEAAKQFSQEVQAKYELEGLTYQLRLSVSGTEAPSDQVSTTFAKSGDEENVGAESASARSGCRSASAKRLCCL